MAEWTEDRIAEARRLWEEGYSASLIAEKIGGGATKNSVIGKAHRGHWGQRRPAYARPNPFEERLRAARAAKAAKAKASLPIPPPPKPRPPPPPPKPRLAPGTYTLLDLRPHECKWPVNDPEKGSAAFLFCGQPRFEVRPYCLHHCMAGYQKGSAPRGVAHAAWVHKPMVTG